MKRILVSLIILLVFLLAGPAALAVAGFCTPAQYGATYYAELPEMYARLKGAEGKRIVVIGGSAVAFGLRGDLMEEEIAGYTVCPFGLYGSIGTKYMMDLAEGELREGDVVLLAPEQVRQSLSLYFGAEYIWKAADGNFGLLGGIRSENAGDAAVGYFPFVAQKYAYLTANEPPMPEDVYAKSSFDSACTLVYDRPHNIMPDGVGETPVSFSEDVMDPAFPDYVNGYAARLEKRGVKLLFGFCPMNASAVVGEEDEIAAYRDFLAEKLTCEVMGTPRDYLFAREWFYDNNVHMNSAGAVVYTRRLVKDLKGVLGDPTPIGIEIPEMPALPSDGPVGSDEFSEYFLYEEHGDGMKITGLSEKGLAAASLILPASCAGKRVTGFAAETFRGNTHIEEIRLQDNIRSIEDGSFAGCTALRRVYLAEGCPPANCTVGLALLEDAPAELRFYVERARFAAYCNDYFWSRYAASIVAY